MHNLLNMACVCTVAQIEQFCGGVNAPGLDRTLHVTCEDQVDAIPAPGAGTHLISDDIEMREYAAGPPEIEAGLFYDWGFSKEDMSFESVEDDNGEWTTTVKIFILKLEAEKSYILNGMSGDNHIVVVTDRNGNPRLVGAKNNGATFRKKEQTNPRNGYEVTITWKSAHSPYFYTGAIPT